MIITVFYHVLEYNWRSDNAVYYGTIMRVWIRTWTVMDPGCGDDTVHYCDVLWLISLKYDCWNDTLLLWVWQRRNQLHVLHTEIIFDNIFGLIILNLSARCCHLDRTCDLLFISSASQNKCVSWAAAVCVCVWCHLENALLLITPKKPNRALSKGRGKKDRNVLLKQISRDV